MIQLHVLALPGEQKLDLFLALLGRQLEDFMAKDPHGNLPIHYICLSNASLEIFQLALDTQRSAFPHQQPDWKALVWITETVESYKYVVHSSI
jgi:ankyrin repeat protein